MSIIIPMTLIEKLENAFDTNDWSTVDTILDELLDEKKED